MRCLTQFEDSSLGWSVLKARVSALPHVRLRRCVSQLHEHACPSCGEAAGPAMQLELQAVATYNIGRASLSAFWSDVRGARVCLIFLRAAGRSGVLKSVLGLFMAFWDWLRS